MAKSLVEYVEPVAHRRELVLLMKKRDLEPLTESEWRVMRIVWQLESCTAREVYILAGEKFGWAPTTVKTFLSLLVEKGYLSTRRTANRYIYKPKRTVLQSLYQAADSLLEKTLAGSEAPLVAYLVKNSKLSKDEIESLRELLDTFEND
jgi:predicted transcriptional regulator